MIHSTRNLFHRDRDPLLGSWSARGQPPRRDSVSRECALLSRRGLAGAIETKFRFVKYYIYVIYTAGFITVISEASDELRCKLAFYLNSLITVTA